MKRLFLPIMNYDVNLHDMLHIFILIQLPFNNGSGFRSDPNEA